MDTLPNVQFPFLAKDWQAHVCRWLWLSPSTWLVFDLSLVTLVSAVPAGCCSIVHQITLHICIHLHASSLQGNLQYVWHAHIGSNNNHEYEVIAWLCRIPTPLIKCNLSPYLICKSFFNKSTRLILPDRCFLYNLNLQSCQTKRSVHTIVIFM